MQRFQFELADASCDADLRQLLAGTPMAGTISIAFAREPSYFGAAEVDGEFVQVVVVRDQTTGRIVGMGSRAVSTQYVSGTEQPVGYLSGLRLLPEFRGQARLLVRGFQMFRELHQDRRTAIYLTTIADDNEPALRLLAANRAGMPVYHYLGKYVTLVFQKRKPTDAINSMTGRDFPDGLEIRTACASDRAAVHAFLQQAGLRRQFFPAYGEHELFASTGRLKDLRPAQTWLAFLHDRLVGTLGFWNQQAFKQILVHDYQPWTKVARPLYNAWARWLQAPQLPAPGNSLPAIYGALPVVQDDDEFVFQKLLVAAQVGCKREGDATCLLGLFETDPLLAVARRSASREYLTRLYVVYWPEQEPDLNSLHDRIPYLELGCL